MRLNKVKRNLECVIEPDKLREFSRELAIVDKKLDSLKGEKSAFNKRIGADISANESKRIELVDKVLTGKEQRSVDCDVLYHFDRKEKEFIRKDTKELVDTDIITEEELQEEIALKEKDGKTKCDFRNKEMSEDQCYRCFKKGEYDPKIKSKTECKEKNYKKGEKKDEVKPEGNKNEKNQKPEQKPETGKSDNK